MKLLHVHDFFAPGNSRFGFDMDRLLARRGHEIHVLAAVGERGPADGAEIEGVRFHTYPFRGDLSGWSRYRWAARENRDRFAGLQQALGFDVLVLNQPICATAVTAVPEAQPLPRVYSFLSPWAAEWEAEHPEVGWAGRLVNSAWRDWLEGRALDRADRVFVESDFIRGQLRGRHPAVPDSKVTLVPGSVDLARFAPDGSQASNRARFGIGPGPVVLTVRRLVERMGIDLLLRAAARIPDLQVVVGGEGPHRERFEALARELGVRARFLGFVPDEDLPPLYRAADLFVLPTRALEGFGLVAIEAMACGTPALGTPVGAIPEVLGPLGLVVAAPTEEAIGEGIRRFFSDRDPALPARCREHVAGRYDWYTTAAQVEAVLLEVIRESAGHGRG
jgi:glycosyltransferase involved in cell wall biosynthesis